jgi:malic enzyme
MAAVKLRWPRALIQFEDFQSKHAIKLLMRYKKEYLMFNDDIQGTASTVLAGLYGAMKVIYVDFQYFYNTNKNQVFCMLTASTMVKNWSD